MCRTKTEDEVLQLEDPELARGIDNIVTTLVHAPEWREDFRQEALIHFWHTTAEHPGKGLRWYLQRCSYRIRNLVRLGRSVDSLKHCDSPVAREHSQSTDASPVSELASSVDVYEDVATRDAVSELLDLLSARDRQVLLLLASGNTVQDIAGRLNRANSTITRARHRIATAATKIGYTPFQR